MVDRRAMIVTSWQANGRPLPTSQKILSIAKRWGDIFAEDRYTFRSLRDRNRVPEVFVNPRRSDLRDELDNVDGASSATELLFFFVGHAIRKNASDLFLILGKEEDGNDHKIALSTIISDIENNTSIRKLIFIVDACHAADQRASFLEKDPELRFYMAAGGSGYAYNAVFSDILLSELERVRSKTDHRIDRRKGGMTYERLFQVTQRRLNDKLDGDVTIQVPSSFGDYGGHVLWEIQHTIPQAYHPFAGARSVYARVHKLLNIIGENSPSWVELITLVGRERCFLLQHADDGNDIYLSSSRVAEYIEFLREIEWIAQPEGRFEVLPRGAVALNESAYNQVLIEDLDDKVFPEGFCLDNLKAIVAELSHDMIPPTPLRIRERAGDLGIFFELNPSIRLGLQLLPTTGLFLKGNADAIFPPELNG